VPSQLAVLQVLKEGGYDKHLRSLRATLERQRQVAMEGIHKHFPSAVRATQPEGGYFVWLELPETVDALELHRLALSQNISVAPGQMFSADRRFRHHIRINYGHPREEQLAPALKTLGRLVQAMAGSPKRA